VTNQALITEGWAPPATSQISSPRAATTVAVLGEDRILAEQTTDAMDPDDRLHVQAWRRGDDPLDVELIVAELAAAGAGVVCAAADVPLPISFAVASIVDRDHPEMSVILIASPDGDVWRDALRAGVRDVIEPGRVDLELKDAIRRATARTAHVREQWTAPTAAEEAAAGKVIVVLSPKGGSGKTMVTSNLAVALAQTEGASVALVDLDVQFGDSATALGLTPERSIGQLSTMPTIDSTTLKVFLTPHEPSGAFVLCGSESPEEGDAVTAEHADRIVELLTADFQYVIVDTPAGLDERTLAVLERATDVVCVTSTDVSSIRSLAKELGVLSRLGLLSAQRHFVLNRADARVGIEVADVEAALGMTTDAAIPSARAVPLSMNQGRPIVIDSASSPAARELLKLAARIEGRDDNGRKVRLPWRRK
jgi:pilus assembly protein CpaE